MPEDNYKPVDLCSFCLNTRVSGLSYEWSECCVTIKFTGITVDQYRENIRQQELMILMVEKERERKAKLRAKKQNRAATKIQAFVRSVLCRKVTADFIEERRVFIELREEEMKTRRSALYRALELVGLQPVTLHNTIIAKYTSLIFYIWSNSICDLTLPRSGSERSFQAI